MLRSVSARFALAVALVATMGVLAAGCGSSSFAYSVNGNETSQADFNRELDALADNETFSTAYETQVGAPIRDSDGTISTDFAAQWMTVVINAEIMGDAADDRDVELTDETREQAEAEAPMLFAFAEPDGGAAIWEEFPDWFRDDVVERFAKQLALLDELTPEVTDEEVRATFDQEVGAVVEDCESGKFVSHLIVETQEEAEALKAELDGGASFLELTLEHSTDPGLDQNQGYYDCYTPGSGFVAEFEAGIETTPVGEISGPVQTEFGFHLIKIDAEPPFETLSDLIRQSMAQPDQEEMTAIVEDADVKVDDKYGEWVVEGGAGRVVPPESDDGGETPGGEVPGGEGGEIDLEEIDPELLEQLEQQLPEGGTGEVPVEVPVEGSQGEPTP